MKTLRSWMIALSAGLMIAGFAPALPTVIGALCLGLAGAHAGATSKRWHILIGGCCVGFCLGSLYGIAQISRQPVAACLVGEIAVTGTVVGLVETREIRPGQVRQRFHFRVTPGSRSSAWVRSVCCSPITAMTLSHRQTG